MLLLRSVPRPVGAAADAWSFEGLGSLHQIVLEILVPERFLTASYSRKTLTRASQTMSAVVQTLRLATRATRTHVGALSTANPCTAWQLGRPQRMNLFQALNLL